MEASKRVKEIEISIRDLFYFCISRWRVLIIWLILGAVLGTGVGVYRNYKANQSGIYQDSAELKSRLSASEITTSETAAASLIYYINSYENLVDFIQNSAFQQLDPYAINAVELKYLIKKSEADTLQEDETASVQAFAALITGKSFEEALAKEFPEEENIRYYYEGTVIADTSLQEKGILTVNIYNNDDEQLDKIARAVKQTVIEKKEEAEKKVGAITITLISENRTVINDSGVYYAQQKNITNLDEIKDKIAKIKEKLNDSERAYVDNLIFNNCDSPYRTLVINVDASKPVSGISINKKWILIGAVLGVIVALLCIAIKYVVSAKLRNAIDLEELANIQLLATFMDEATTKKRRNTKLDRAIRKKRIGRKSMSYKDNVNLTATKLEMIANHKGMKKICVAIGKDVESDASFMNDVMKDCADKIEIAVVRDITENAEALLSLADADGLILLEQMDESKYDHIAMVMQLCASSGVEIIGAIVVE